MNGDLKSENSLLEQTLQLLCDCSDLSHLHLPIQQIDIIYFSHLVSSEALRKDAVEPFSDKDADMVAILSQSSYKHKPQASELVTGILAGNIAIYFKNRGYLHEAYAPESRSIQNSETESVINGPMDSFTESLSTNLSLIRRRIKDSGLKAITFTIGTRTGTTMVLLYLEELAEPTHVQQLSEMIDKLNIQAIYDTNTLVQYLSPDKLSIFPQFLTSARPDHIADKLTSGKVIGLLDGSPIAFSAPTSFIEFFSSPDDYYQPWAVASAVRILRFIALFITLCFTAFYVSLVTYHYEMIPPTLLLNLMESRNKVPFSPLLEAIVMEMTIELLREAGARLPTKIGPTIGTVGGIVIGQAAVQAGITSNILIISVAISAIASFVIPSYIMSSSIRLLRFVIILMAGLLGNFGLVCGLSFIMIQLSGLNMLGISYLYPIAPSKPSRWIELIIRAPIQILTKLKKPPTNNPNE
ncbi:spore germination protein [Paenibacillus sp. V4I3]|uniref:spore germination protein n=1 Tax=Paenibacillus sp. V4I3 TaxID=3042305 RepID=UPI00278078C7|nr:spore germination protein [Paenibacillus sp. V4I3]MDQ0874847.1 spore germination protein [Paenibacillus sp. V4I3]